MNEIKMYYYKSLDGHIHAIEDTKFEYVLPKGSVLIPEEEVHLYVEINPEPAPITINAKQIRQAFTKFSLRTQIESAVANGSQDLKDWWEYSTTYTDKDKEALEVITIMNISKEKLHEIFEYAITV